MTRLEQALRWWANHDSMVPIPPRHFVELLDAGMIACHTPVEVNPEYGLTLKGAEAMATWLEARSTR